MTPEKVIDIAYNIARNAEPDTFEYFSKSWRLYLGNSFSAEASPALDDCAELIRGALEDMDKKNAKPSKLSAAKRICSNAFREQFHGVWTDNQGRTCMCDGYRAARLTDTFASIPTVEVWQELPRVFADPEKYTNKLNLPTVAEVKKTMAEQKAAEGKNCIPVYDFGEGLPMVRCEYLLDMLAILPGCTAYGAELSADISPIYFRAENGDGVLLPINKRNRKH